MGYACRQLASSLTTSPQGDFPIWIQHGIDAQKADDLTLQDAEVASVMKRQMRDLQASLCTSVMSQLVGTVDDWIAEMRGIALTKHQKDDREKDAWDYGILCHFCGVAAKPNVEGVAHVSCRGGGLALW